MIVATAGHVDHGKTFLVKALTGMDTDRLEEEKRRGLSINLGFAYLKSVDNKTIAFVDVPGHTRFINNMIAGINGIDLGMLVVAADDGPMPQTREHMDVLKLLGVTRFILVISKVDRVDVAQVELVREKALTLFNKSADVPVFKVATPAEKGIPELASYLKNEANKQPAKSTSGHFRLSIDRAFLIKGSGLVVTGTIASGSVRVGDSLMLLPANVSVRVRALQVQEEERQQASSGQRCALNISGDIEKEEIERGDWLVESGISQTTSRFDARVSLLQNAPFALKHMSPIKLYIGAKRISARLALLEGKIMSPGQTNLVQLVLKRPLHCCHGDRLLLRDDSENETLGGGIVLDPGAPASKRSSPSRLLRLAAMEQATAQQVLETILFIQKQMVNLTQFCVSCNIREDEKTELLSLAAFKDDVKLIDLEDIQYAIASSQWQPINEWVKQELAAWGNKSSSGKKKCGLQRDKFQLKFKEQFPGIEPEPIFEYMQSAGILTIAKDHILPNVQRQELSEEHQQQWKEIKDYLMNCGLQVPALSDINKKLGYEKQSILTLCNIAAKFGWLIAIADNRFVATEHVRQFSKVAISLGGGKQCFSVAEFKRESHIGRNLAVEVLEYFDRIGFTLRKDSGRVVLHPDRINTILN